MILRKNNIKIIEFDLTTMCNAMCPLCFRNNINFPLKYQTNFYRKSNEIINQIKEYPNVSTIYLIGQMSEPTLHPEFLKIVEEIKKMYLKIKICTNGDLHNNDFWERLSQLLDDGDEIWFTICGYKQETHEYYRKNTKLQNILTHAEIIRKKHKIDCVKCIKFKYNINEIESNEFKNMIQVFSNVEYLDTCFPKPEKEFKKPFNYNDFLPTDEIYKKYNKLNNIASFYIHNYKKDICCQSIFDNQIQIDAYGDVFPCYIFMENNADYKWDGEYDDITIGKYECCKFCNRKIVEYCDKSHTNNII